MSKGGRGSPALVFSTDATSHCNASGRAPWVRLGLRVVPTIKMLGPAGNMSSIWRVLAALGISCLVASLQSNVSLIKVLERGSLASEWVSVGCLCSDVRTCQVHSKILARFRVDTLCQCCLPAWQRTRFNDLYPSTQETHQIRASGLTA